MKKNLLWMLAAILVCGLNLTACTNNDNPMVILIIYVQNKKLVFCRRKYGFLRKILFPAQQV